MKVDPVRAKSLVSALQAVAERVTKASNGRNVSFAVQKIQCRNLPRSVNVRLLMESVGPSGSSIEAQACERCAGFA